MNRTQEGETIASNLINWHLRTKRDYPWRRTKDPFRILVAEIMLQRTKANQVEAVYSSFIKQFPDSHTLSKANMHNIEEYFQRLGLMWRARLLRKLAADLVEKHEGKVPQTREDLLKLPSIGEYVADAILSFAFQKDVAVVDSNVCRVLSRVFGMSSKGEARRDKRFRRKAEEILPKGKAREYNLAILDHAALICRPKRPRCPICPIRTMCSYYSKLIK